MSEKQDHPQHLWDQFIKLGDMIGDGLHRERGGGWINRDYNKLAKILVPEIKEAAAARRKRKADHVNEQMQKLLEKKKCDCGGNLKQSRSGSKVAYCALCNRRYRASK